MWCSRTIPYGFKDSRVEEVSFVDLESNSTFRARLVDSSQCYTQFLR